MIRPQQLDRHFPYTSFTAIKFSSKNISDRENPQLITEYLKEMNILPKKEIKIR